MSTSSASLLHLFDGDPSFRCDAHNLGGNAQRLVGVEESHSRNWVVHFADDLITLFAQIVGDPVEITYRQTEGNVLCSACGILREIVMEHALAGNRLDEFDEGTSVIGLSGQPFAGHGLAIIGHAQILCGDMFRLGKASDAQGVRKEFHGDVNVRDHPADLGQFKGGVRY